MKDPAGRSPSPPRVIIEDIETLIDAGRFPIKRVIGESVRVSARIFTEGHDRLAAVVRVRQAGDQAWHEVPMREGTHDRWEAEFAVERAGRCEYTVEAWVDGFGSWRERLAKKHQAGQFRSAASLHLAFRRRTGRIPRRPRALGGAPRPRRGLAGPQPGRAPRADPGGPGGAGAGPIGSVVRVLPALLCPRAGPPRHLPRC